MKKFFRLIIILIISFALVACSCQNCVVRQLKGNVSKSTQVSWADQIRWWNYFNDPTLSQLIKITHDKIKFCVLRKSTAQVQAFSEVGKNYVLLRETQQKRRAFQPSLVAARELLHLLEVNYRAGRINYDPIATQRVVLNELESMESILSTSEKRYRNGLLVMLGKNAALLNQELEKIEKIPVFSGPISPNLPTDSLLQIDQNRRAFNFSFEQWHDQYLKLSLMRSRYKSGRLNYMKLLNQQLQTTKSRINLIESQSEEILSVIDAYKTFGGAL